eukprot:CCRYP_010139-RA/>CCRYP_010139-RA protein AED:0.16 eAED:0.16 QI:0/-1/0/1/-1/1/1/0/319
MLYVSLFLFAIISYLLYKYVLSPAQTQPTPSSSVVTQRNTASSSRSTAPSSSTTTAATDGYFSYGTPRHPPHFIPPDKWDRSTSLSKHLLQGIVPFRSTPAHGYETRIQKQSSSHDDVDMIVTNRKERARIFARLFSISTSTGEEGSSLKKKQPPPNRGANIVVTIHPSDVSCIKLQKALMLLGTYYNLFVLVDAGNLFANGNGDDAGVKEKQQQMKEQRECIQKFRSEILNSNELTATTTMAMSFRLNSQILPPHRIVFLSTPEGRVAFVRQLHGVELVVDGDEKVTRELERFGHCVLVYPRDGGEGGYSALGKFLVP